MAECPVITSKAPVSEKLSEKWGGPRVSTSDMNIKEGFRQTTHYTAYGDPSSLQVL